MDLIRSILQKSLGVLGYPLGVSVQIPNYPSAHVFKDRTVNSTLGHLSTLRKLLPHSPTQAKETQNKHSIPTDTTIQQKKNKRRGGAPPYHQPDTTTAIHFQQFIIHHKIDLKSTENQTKPSENPT